MQLAALSTYFNGVLSADDLVRDTSRAARAILRRYGAFVGDDWVLPAKLGGTDPNWIATLRQSATGFAFG